VARSAGKGTPGTIATCRHCNLKFKVGKGQGKGQSRDGESCAVRPNRPHVANTVLKDNDLVFKLRLGAGSAGAGGGGAAQLAAQLRADADFLERMGVMDYSLLVGVHNRRFRVNQLGAGAGAAAAGELFSPAASAAGAGAGAMDADEPAAAALRAAASSGPPPPFFRADAGGMDAAVIEGPGTFYLGIIDILQDWSFIKKVERTLKRFLLCHDPRGISVMPPDDYAERFRRRVIEAIFELPDADDAASPTPLPSPQPPLPPLRNAPRGAQARAAADAAPIILHENPARRLERLRRAQTQAR
jgi:1-phosphatidylinositol-4-phosphate 5-kinase